MASHRHELNELRAGSMKELRVHVHEMDCADEAALVRRALASNPAIQSIEFDLIHGFADIAFDERATSEEALLRIVQSTGLGAHAVHGEDGHRVVAAEHAAHDDRAPHGSTIATAVSGVLFAVGWLIEGLAADGWLDVFIGEAKGSHDPRAVVAYALSAAAGLWPMWRRAFAAVRHRRLDMHALVCLTVIGAAVIGEWSEGAAVAFLFGLAHRMESWSIERARAEIAALVGRGPSLVAEGRQKTAVASKNASAVAWLGPGGPSGPAERWIERFAAIYTPSVVAAAAVVAIIPPLVDGQWAVWFYRALLFLVLACPCALVISTPVTMIAALSAAARRGILVKGAAVLERAAQASLATRQGLADAGVIVASAQSTSVDRADVVLKPAGTSSPPAEASEERAIALLLRLARLAMRVVRQNVAIALMTKLAFLISAPFGFAPLWMAVLADTGATVIVTLNGLQLLSGPPRDTKDTKDTMDTKGD
jgi:cation transport ATPase